MGDARAPDGAGTRAQSEVLGFALMVGLVVAGAAVVVVFGSVALNETEDAVRAQQLEQSMTQFDAEASQVVLGRSRTRTVTVANDNVEGEVVDDGRMIVEWVDHGGGDVELANESLDAVV